MTTKQLIAQALEKWGFPVTTESDRSIVFRYQMNYIQASEAGNAEGRSAVIITLTNMFTADSDEKMAMGLRACNDINNNTLHAKLYIDSDSDLIISSEFFFTADSDFEGIFNAGLRSLIAAKKKFTARYSEIEEEFKLIAELSGE